jgi:aconitate hydratase
MGTSSGGYQEPLEDGSKAEIMISPESQRLQILEPFNEFREQDFRQMPVLMKVKGKCTTDHISMAGAWLRFRGHLENISDNYMIGAVNYFNGKLNLVRNILTGNYEPVPKVAKHYRDSGLGSIVIGEENFGEGSSREHAAMEPRFLGVKAILVKSFARIHETNLKKQGILTLTFSDPGDYEKIREDDRISIEGLDSISPGKKIKLVIDHSDSTHDIIESIHTYNENQIAWFRAGSALNLINKSLNL